MILTFLRGLPISFALLCLLTSANGQNADPSPSSSSGARYGDLSESTPIDLGLVGVDNEDSRYTVDIVLGGEKFTVEVDTGSSDLWVDLRGRDIQLLNTTDVVVDTHYAVGEVKGNVVYAELQLGPYVIPSQAFINASEVTDMPENGAQGLMGMAFETAMIYIAMQATWGDSAANELARGPMSNLIAQNPSAPGFFDIELGRTSANGTKENNHFFIGQHLPSAVAVDNAPKLERVNPYHWSAVMDGMTINGKPFTGWNKSHVPGVPDGKIGVMFDTGYTMSAFPQEVVDAIYGSIPGAMRFTGPTPHSGDPNQNNWVVPCNTSANVSFVFAGQEYPVHPLDVVDIAVNPGLAYLDDIPLTINATICTNRFGSGSYDPTYDLLLGMGFLRNVYASFHYGNYTPPGLNITGEQPYVQLLSVTDRDTAWAEYYEYYDQKVLPGPPEMAPGQWPTFIADFNSLQSASENGNNATSTTSPSTTPGRVSSTAATPGPTGSVASSPDSADSTDNAQNLEVAGFAAEGSSSDSKDSGSSKYRGIALGLLGANVAVGLAVLVVTFTLCIRGAREKREARYKPLRLSKEDGGFEPDRALLDSE